MNQGFIIINITQSIDEEVCLKLLGVVFRFVFKTKEKAVATIVVTA